jgi:hypothetical protein
MSKSSIAVIAILFLTLLAVTFFWANRPRRVVINAELPASFPEESFSHASFEELLLTYVDVDGRVDYARWHQFRASVQMLESYLAAVAKFSPDNAPHRFPGRSDELAYWMYGYNAYVIKSVLDHWPIRSVTDIKAPIEAVTGLGFFYRQRFLFGGTALSLYTVENEEIRKAFHDPRIHFVLYCASGSCPVLRPELPTGEDLERLLQEATFAFISDPKNVRIDHEKRAITLSAIFKMYRSDFLRELTRKGLSSENGAIDYVRSVAPTSLRAELRTAVDYSISFADYDWSIAEVKHP